MPRKPMAEVDLFQAHRSRLFGVAYRMLGSASDAEDVVQDAWLRYSSAQPADLRSPAAYLTTIVTRLCLDRLKSARTAREEYVGPWLPEPLVTAMIMRVAGRLDSVYAFTVKDDVISAVHVVRNPDKLQFLERHLSGA